MFLYKYYDTLLYNNKTTIKCQSQNYLILITFNAI